MAEAHKILPHDEPREVVSDVWVVMGSLPFPLKRTMTIVRLSDGSLLLHSVIAMDEAGMAKLDALGKPSLMIVPHAGHRMDAPFYKARYPDLRVVAPAAVRAKVEEVVPVDATAEEALPPLGVKVHRIAGFKHGELGYEVEAEGGKVLIFSDIVTTRDPPPGVGGWLMAALGGGITGRLGVPRMIRLMMLKDKAAARASIDLLARIPNIKAISVGHGRALVDGCSEALKEAAATL
jgi:hypothetical protein